MYVYVYTCTHCIILTVLSPALSLSRLVGIPRRLLTPAARTSEHTLYIYLSISLLFLRDTDEKHTYTAERIVLMYVYGYAALALLVSVARAWL